MLQRTLSAVTGACAAIRREFFFEVGGLEEANLPVTYNDVDLCLRLRDYGYPLFLPPFAEMFRLDSASRGLDQADPAKPKKALGEMEYMRKTWGSLVDSADPFRNPNLLFAWERFETRA
jgi:O-antigen biosynthesis protein